MLECDYINYNCIYNIHLSVVCFVYGILQLSINFKATVV